jgi:hypothetical protein
VVHGLDCVDFFIGDDYSLLFCNIPNKVINITAWELIEPHTNKLAFERFVYFADVVAYKTKPDIGRGGL